MQETDEKQQETNPASQSPSEQDLAQESQAAGAQTAENTEAAAETAGAQAAQDPCAERLKQEQEKLLRVYADFENIKKRLEREKFQAIEYANEAFARDLLDVVDTLDLALSSGDGSVEKLKEGVELIRANLVKTFAKHGVEEIKTDAAFDPNFHEAVMQVASPEHENGQIVSVLKKGYLCKTRVIRPSMVSICKKDEDK